MWFKSHIEKKWSYLKGKCQRHYHWEIDNHDLSIMECVMSKTYSYLLQQKHLLGLNGSASRRTSPESVKVNTVDEEEVIRIAKIKKVILYLTMKLLTIIFLISRSALLFAFFCFACLNWNFTENWVIQPNIYRYNCQINNIFGFQF